MRRDLPVGFTGGHAAARVDPPNVAFLAVLIGFIFGVRRVGPEAPGRVILLGSGVLSIVLIAVAVLVVFTQGV